MPRLTCPLVFLLSLCIPLPLHAAGNDLLIKRYATDPVNYFVKNGDGFVLKGEIAVAALPTTPVPVIQEEPNGFLMIKIKDQLLWFDPMDVDTTATRTTGVCRKDFGVQYGTRNFGTQGIGENN